MSRETEPLLPRYEEDTSRQQLLHQKLHSYQMIRALAEGYMPSNDQVIANLRSLLATEFLNPQNREIGSIGRQLVRDCRIWIQVLIELFRDKNGDDQIQEFLWHLSKSRASLDPRQVSQRASASKARADTKAGT